MPFQKENKINLGRHFSKEHRDKISKAHMGMKTALKHGNSPYENYHIMKGARIELLKRTKGKCELCDDRGGHIHHLDGSNNNHNLKNLIFVCTKCHSFLHARLNQDGRHIRTVRNTKYFRKYGMTLREIGEKFKVSRQAIYQWVQCPKKEAWLKSQLGLK